MSFETPSEVPVQSDEQLLASRIAEEIKTHGPLRGPELAEHMGITTSDISGTVWQMLDRGDLRFSWECKLTLRPEVPDSEVSLD